MGVIVAISGGGGSGVSIVQIPTVTGDAFAYTGTEQGPTITYENEADKNRIVVTGATAKDKGSHTLTLALKDKKSMFWSDMSQADKTYEYTIGDLTIQEPTVTVGTYTYNGSAQGPEVSNLDDKHITVTNAKETNAGTYDLTFTLKNTEFMKWTDGSTAPKTYSYTIKKAAGTLTLSADAVTFDKTNTSATITATGYKGALSVKSGDETVASVSVKDGTITISSVNSKSGDADILVTAEETANYAALTKTIKVTANFVYINTFANTVANGKLAEVAEALKNGSITQDNLVWAVGDEATVNINNVAYKWVIQSKDTNGSTGYTFTDGSKVHYIIGMKNCLTQKHNMNNSDTNSGSWDKSGMRSYLNSSFRTSLPSDLQNAFKQFNTKTASEYNSSSVKSSQDYFALPAEIEIFGKRSYCNNIEANIPLHQFEWYKTSANRVKKIGDNGSADWWWERSPDSGNSAGFCIVASDGSANGGIIAGYSRGVSPFGCI